MKYFQNYPTILVVHVVLSYPSANIHNKALIQVIILKALVQPTDSDIILG